MGEHVIDYVQFLPGKAPAVNPWEELADGSHRNLFILPWEERRTRKTKLLNDGDLASDLSGGENISVMQPEGVVFSSGEMPEVGVVFSPEIEGV